MTWPMLPKFKRDMANEKNTTAACGAAFEMIDCAAGCVIETKDRNLCWVLGSEITFEVFSGDQPLLKKAVAAQDVYAEIRLTHWLPQLDPAVFRWLASFV